MRLVLIVLFFVSWFAQAQDIRINEVVSSNSVHTDEDGDTPDWFELYNDGSVPLNINGWGVTDDDTDLSKFTFPDFTIHPQEYLLVWASGKDRSSFISSRTLVNRGDIHKYKIPNSQMPSNWTSQNFNDSSWSQGPSGFGYGDDDDATTVPSGTKSIFTRIQFDITDLESLTSLIFDIDYDDGFVAYINGQEIARSDNMIGLGNPPSYDSGTSNWTEPLIQFGNSPLRFFVDDVTNILVEGENTLAIQLHNHNANSSDLTLIPFLSAVFSAPNSSGVTPPSILDLSNGLSGANFHTNFKISSSSETLILSNHQGNIVDQLVVGELKSNVSYGVSNQSDNLVYFTETTPGAVNSVNEYVGFVTEDIVFSHDGGVFHSSFLLSLTGNSAGQEIRYTTDATEPTVHSTRYTGSIYMYGNKVIRARIFQDNSLLKPSVSRTYLYNVNQNIDMIHLVTEPDHFFDENTGIYVPGLNYDYGVPHWGANFWADWERPIHVSFYDKNTGALGTSFNAGVKIYGAWSRGQNEQRSLSLFARSQYGTPKFKYPFFDNVNYDKFESLVLRNSGQDWLDTSIRDITITSLMEGSGLDYGSYRPVSTYLNGAYWGMYSLREKNNEHMLASKHDIDADDITILTNNAQEVEGDNQTYNTLINYIKNTDLNIDANFDYVRERIDLKNYAMYQVAQIYLDNTDWPGNNIKYWTHPEGKWRWILYDTDFGFSVWFRGQTYENNTLSFALEPNGPGWPNPSWSTLLFRKLLTNTSFKHQFINRYADELNTRFQPDHVKDHIESVYQKVEPELEAHYNKWGAYWNNENPIANDSPNDIRTKSDAIASKNIMKEFADHRHGYAKDHLETQFSLADYTLAIVNNYTNRGSVVLNDNLSIQEAVWEGNYYTGVPIQLRAVPETGYVFSRWLGVSNSSDATIELDLSSGNYIMPVFELAANLPLIINEINYNSLDTVDPEDWVEIYNPNNTSIDMSNWVLKDDDDTHSFTIPDGTMIDANGYLVFSRDLVDFSAVFSEVTNVIGDIDFKFGNSDAVRLYNAQGVLEDEVYYTSDAPWPTCAKDLGPTLELKDSYLDNSLAESWDCINTTSYGSPGLYNTDTMAIDDVSLKHIKFYPNPVKNTLFIDGAKSEVLLTVYDVFGKVVLSEFGRFQIDVSSLVKGVYFVKVTQNNQSYTRKFIKGE